LRDRPAAGAPSFRVLCERVGKFPVREPPRQTRRPHTVGIPVHNVVVPNLRGLKARVGTAALGCPAERSSAAIGKDTTSQAAEKHVIRIRASLQRCRKCTDSVAPSGAEVTQWSFSAASSVVPQRPAPQRATTAGAIYERPQFCMTDGGHPKSSSAAPASSPRRSHSRQCRRGRPRPCFP